MRILSKKTAVITGGSRGIGREIALQMSSQGANIAIIYYGNDEEAQETINDIKNNNVNAIAYKCNVADFNQVKELCNAIIADFKTVDILVNNAGITKDSLVLTMSEEDFDNVIAVNLKGVFNVTKTLSRYIIKSKSGRIINISSVSGLMGNPGQANYSASKAGLIGFTKTIAKEFATRGVTCNAIAPGFIDTEMTKSLPESVINYANNAIPLKRMGKVEEVGALAAFLASESASYITGEVIRVDGGLCM